MQLSIVTILYKSSAYIIEFYAHISKEAKKITDDYEIIFVDGSRVDVNIECVHENKCNVSWSV